MLVWSLGTTLQTVFDQDSALEKNLSLNGSILSPNKHGQDLLLVLDVMVTTEKNSVINSFGMRCAFMHMQPTTSCLMR